MAIEFKFPMGQAQHRKLLRLQELERLGYEITPAHLALGTASAVERAFKAGEFRKPAPVKVKPPRKPWQRYVAKLVKRPRRQGKPLPWRAKPKATPEGVEAS